MHVVYRLAVLLAQVAPAGGAGVEDALLQYGVLGVFAIVAGALVRKFIADQRSDLVEARAQRDALVKDMFDVVMPALLRATEIFDRVERRLNEDRERGRDRE